MRYFDAHCHILADDYIAVAVAAGVRGLVCNATAPDDWGRVADWGAHVVGRGVPDVRLAIGVHPWCVDGLPNDWESQMYDLLCKNPSYMAGEIGLDKFRPNFDAQEDIFARQVAMAVKLRRVMHIHCVGAWGGVTRILRDARPVAPFVLHGYAGAPDLIRPLADMGAYFSYGDAVLNSRRRRVRRAVMATPMDRILVESDATVNTTDCALPEIVSEIACLCGMDVAEMSEILYNNSKQVLKNG